MLLPFAIIAVSTIAYWAMVVRARRLRSIREQLNQPFDDLPPELVDSWKQHRLWQYAPDNFVVGGTVAFTTGKALFHLNRIDGSVLDAVDKIYQPGVENSFTEIVGHLRDTAGGSGAAWSGAVSAYKGRLGEDYMAEYLDVAGHHVEMATATNQEGWDAVVDGQLVNFKAGLGVDHIEEHLERFPEIPVITVAEQSTAFVDNEMVTCLDRVSGEEIVEATDNALTSMVEATNFGLDIPVVTLALSAVRNFKPLLSGYSDLGTATINAATDSAGIGIGGAAGAKTGALIGAVVGPLGMFAGTIAGGLIGAMSGGAIAKGFKQKSLVKVKTAYQERVQNYEKTYTAALEAKATSLEQAAQSYQREFSLRRFFWPMPSDLLRDELNATYLNWASDCRKYAAELNKQMSSGKWKKVLLKTSALILSRSDPRSLFIIQKFSMP